MPLLPGSPAIDAGTSTDAPSTDQRGVNRLDSFDIGAFESQGFTVTLLADSTPQSADIGTQFTNPLAVTVSANNPAEPVDGGVVNFLAQPDSSGATAIFMKSAPVITNGQAGMPAMPNNVLGSYTVVGSVGGSGTTTFSLTNTGQVFSSLIVNTTSNTLAPGAELLSLPEAVLFANTDPTGGLTISFDSTVFATPQTITLSGYQLELTKDVTIFGPAAGVTISGNKTSRVFKVDANVNATLIGLTITGGNAWAGGGVENFGSATLTKCTIIGNTGSFSGGGIANFSTAFLTNCTISENTASWYGGGVNNNSTVTFTNCAIKDNGAKWGAGLANSGWPRSPTVPSVEILPVGLQATVTAAEWATPTQARSVSPIAPSARIQPTGAAAC